MNHLNAAGEARMVEVGGKADTERVAVASATLQMQPSTLDRLLDGPKGDAAAVARIAGIMGAKKTPELIPLCHPLFLTGVDVDVQPHPPDRVEIRATARTRGKTGVEMEALTAVSVAALALYDMLKAVEKGIVIGPIRLLEKSGGKSGDWKAT